MRQVAYQCRTAIGALIGGGGHPEGAVGPQKVVMLRKDTVRHDVLGADKKQFKLRVVSLQCGLLTETLD